MSLPHFTGPKLNEYVYKDQYEVIFIYNTNSYEMKSVESVNIDFDIESNDKSIKLIIRDYFELDHNFSDVDIIFIDVYSGSGIIRRRLVFNVKLSKYNQEYRQKDSFQKYLEEVSTIGLIFKVNNYEIIIDDFIETGNIQNWIRDYKIEKILK